MPTKPYQRQEVRTLLERLSEPPRFLIFVAGPRQVGKTTLVRDALSRYEHSKYHFIPVDQPDVLHLPGFASSKDAAYVQDARPRDTAWLVAQWQRARAATRESDDGHILVLDEIQKIPRWSEAVKGLWDADRAEKLKLHIVLLGSSPLLMQKGMSESLTGRYELIHVTHWSFLEMHEAFDFDLEDYVYFGGYPGSAAYIRDEPRWRNYVNGSLIEPSIEKDILMMTRVDKPALLKQLFHLGCNYSGQILSYDKMLGQLQDAGNTTTLARYLEMLGNAGLIYGLQKYAGQQHRRRASSPKFNVLNNALMSAGSGYTKAEAKADRSYWGRLVESAVGAHLYNTGHPDCRLHYWRESSREVDFVIERGKKLTAIEVKSGTASGHASGLDVFSENFGKCRKLLVGDGGVPLVEFLSYPAEHWL
ncbi:MAG: AAA family ATPase [Burkholderiales bacterium RIFCSPLOWO2_02_FULL_57_36]|nr:MAG: AAA family ATPase [Burkholderiales bacterium RIFCSPLOWO2_02_FULL_57_36]